MSLSTLVTEPREPGAPGDPENGGPEEGESHLRAILLVVGLAVAMGGAAIAVAAAVDRQLVDPEGSFLGPSSIRLPLLLAGAVVLDMLPRIVWYSKGRPRAVPGIVRERLRTHWNRKRLTLVATGIVGFYIVYVSYRNLKSFLPDVRPCDHNLQNRTQCTGEIYDHELHIVDRALFFGHEPGAVLHDLLGTGISAHLLSYVYLWFLPLVPLAVTAWVVWAKPLRNGYWFVGSQCIAWTLGTISYYALPTLGPGIAYPYVYQDIPNGVPAEHLMESLQYGRVTIVIKGLDGAVQSVAGFASLHCAITLLVALLIQHTLRARWLKILFWVNFAITLVATLYFGWHYVADDVAGVMIAFVSFYLGGLAAGHRFPRKYAAVPKAREAGDELPAGDSRAGDSGQKPGSGRAPVAVSAGSAQSAPLAATDS